MVPAQGYDWSGIRDSSLSAVRSMYRVAAAYEAMLGAGVRPVTLELTEVSIGIDPVSGYPVVGKGLK